MMNIQLDGYYACFEVSGIFWGSKENCLNLYTTATGRIGCCDCNPSVVVVLEFASNDERSNLYFSIINAMKEGQHFYTIQKDQYVSFSVENLQYIR